MWLWKVPALTISSRQIYPVLHTHCKGDFKTVSLIKIMKIIPADFDNFITFVCKIRLVGDGLY